MKSLAIHCKAPLCLVRRMMVLAFVSGIVARGQETPHEASAADASLLRDYSDNGYALRKVIPVAELPARIPFDKGVVSLVPDPLDRTGPPRFGYAKPYMVVYLINDTDEPIPRIIGELHEVRSQVRFGGNWFPREPLYAGCGSVPPPEDLPARSALALGGVSDQRGDIDGVIRYVFQLPGRMITSEPQRGRYIEREFREALSVVFFNPLMETGDLRGLLKNQWDETMVARNIEEFCVLLELARHHQLALRERSVVMNWMLERTKKQDASRDQAMGMRRIKAVLARPWLIDNDGQAFADRCIAALEAEPSGVYGTPEKCRACVWRLLGRSDALYRDMTISGREYRPAGNASILRLVDLARKSSFNSNDPDVADAAAGFLGNYNITEEMFPTQELFRFLKSNRPRQVHAALWGLYTRKRLSEAIPWLLGRVRENDSNVGEYYGGFIYGIRGDLGAWEKTVLSHLLEANPMEALTSMSGRRIEKLPEEWAGPVRAFLTAQLTNERRKWWADRTERIKQEVTEPIRSERRQALSAVCAGISLLDTRNDPADVLLLESFLNHPAASLNWDFSGGTLCFGPRVAAKQCLERREIKISDGVVTEIKLEPPPPPRDRMEDFMRYITNHESAIVGASLATLIGTFFALWRTRAQAHALSKS